MCERGGQQPALQHHGLVGRREGVLPSTFTDGHGLSCRPRYVPFLCYPALCLGVDRCHAASSVDIEWVFSRGGDQHTAKRNRLDPESLRALLCVGHWLATGLLTVDEISQFLATVESESDEEELGVQPQPTIIIDSESDDDNDK